MSVHDDPRKLAKPLKAEHTASYKHSQKNAVNKTGGKDVDRRNALFQCNSDSVSPLQALLNAEYKVQPKRKPKKHTVDPFMVRQAKLKESNRG